MDSMSIRVLIVGFGYLAQQLTRLLQHHHHIVWGIKRSSVLQDTRTRMLFKAIHDLKPGDLPEVDFVIYCPHPDKPTAAAHKSLYLDDLKHLIQLYSQKESSLPRRFIHISNCAIYDRHGGEWVDESTPCQPKDRAMQIRLQSEELAKTMPFPCTVLRLSGIYGPNRHYLLDQLVDRNAHICFKPQYSNRIHIVDAARAIYHVMHLRQHEDLYLLTDSEPTPINTIVAWLSSVTGIKLPTAHRKESDDAGDQGCNMRINNSRLLHTGFNFEYRNYHQGFLAILQEKGMLVKPG